MEADDHAGPTGEFRTVCPAPGMLYAANGQQLSSHKAEAINAMFEQVPGLEHVSTGAANRSTKRLQAKVIAVDITAKIYCHAAVPTVGHWAADLVDRVLSMWTARCPAAVILLVMDAESNPYKGFEAALRASGAVLPIGTPVTAEMAMPAASEFYRWISDKGVQAAVWALLVSAVQAWVAQENAHSRRERLTIILDGPGGGPIALRPSHVPDAAADLLRTDLAKLYVLVVLGSHWRHALGGMLQLTRTNKRISMIATKGTDGTPSSRVSTRSFFCCGNLTFSAHTLTSRTPRWSLPTQLSWSTRPTRTRCTASSSPCRRKGGLLAKHTCGG